MVRVHELLDHLVEDVPADARRGDRAADVGSADRRDRDALFLSDGLGERQREDAFAAGRRRDPVIGVRGRQVLARRDRDESGATVGVRIDVARLRELRLEFDGAVEEVRAQVDDEVRLGQVEDRRRGGPEDLLARFDQCLRAEVLVGQVARQAGRRRELIDEARQRGTDRSAEDPGLAGRTLALGRHLRGRILPLPRIAGPSIRSGW